VSATGDRRAIIDVVLTQLAALRSDGWAAAHGHLAEELQRRWSVEEFAEVARSGYGALIASVGQRVERLTVQDDAAQLRLALTQGDGSALFAHYELRREGSSWRVGGIALGGSVTAVVSMNGHHPAEG
jgi:hypothetical protein